MCDKCMHLTLKCFFVYAEAHLTIRQLSAPRAIGAAVDSRFCAQEFCFLCPSSLRKNRVGQYSDSRKRALFPLPPCTAPPVKKARLALLASARSSDAAANLQVTHIKLLSAPCLCLGAHCNVGPYMGNIEATTSIAHALFASISIYSTQYAGQSACGIISDLAAVSWRQPSGAVCL